MFDIKLAKITSPFGIKGNLKIESFTENPESIFNYKELFVENLGLIEIKKIRQVKNNTFVVIINAINDRTDAEKIKGQFIYTKKTNLKKLEDDEYYYNDLVGCEVIDQDGTLIGIVKNVTDLGAGCFMETEKNAIPFCNHSIIEVCLDERKIHVHKEWVV